LKNEKEKTKNLAPTIDLLVNNRGKDSALTPVKGALPQVSRATDSKTMSFLRSPPGSFRQNISDFLATCRIVKIVNPYCKTGMARQKIMVKFTNLFNLRKL